MAELMTFDSDDFTIDVSSDGAIYQEMDGVTGFNVNPSPAPTREVRTFKGVTTVRGQPGPGEASFDIGNFLPHLKFWKDLRTHLGQRALSCAFAPRPKLNRSSWLPQRLPRRAPLSARLV